MQMSARMTRIQVEMVRMILLPCHLARVRGFAGILLGTEQTPNADKAIGRKKNDGSYEFTEAERKEKKRLRQANGNVYINLQLSCEELPYDLVSLAKTDELPDGCTRKTWERLVS